VRKVDLATGVITTVAGDGTAGYGGDNGPATSARLNSPIDVAVSGGTLAIADKENHRVRRVDLSTGTITTVAGSGTPGFEGDGGPATAARLWYPEGVAWDGSTLYVADTGGSRVGKVTAEGRSTVAAAATGPSATGSPARVVMPGGVTLDRHNLYVSEGLKSRVRQVRPDGIITTVAGDGGHGYGGDGASAAIARLRYPRGLGADPAGRLYLADTRNHRIRAVDRDDASADAGPADTGVEIMGLHAGTTYVRGAGAKRDQDRRLRPPRDRRPRPRCADGITATGAGAARSA
jgi:sugar lactone lactonase YvrE